MQSAKNDTAALKRNQAVLLLFRIFFGSEKNGEYIKEHDT